MNAHWIRFTARSLALVWAGWWVFFAAASTAAPNHPQGMGTTLLVTAVAALIFFGSALLAWKWETFGAVLLLLEGLAVVTLYPVLMRAPFATYVVILLTLALPPLIAGSLLLYIRPDWFPTPGGTHGSPA